MTAVHHDASDGQLQAKTLRLVSPAPDTEDYARSLAVEVNRERLKRDARRLLDQEERGPGPQSPKAYTLRSFVAEIDEQLEWRIDGWLPVGGRAVLAAQMKAGKTTAIGAFTRSLVDGDPWLGRARVHPISRKVVIIDTEMSKGQLRRWLRDQRIRNDDRVVVVPLRGNAAAFDILDADGLARWAALLREQDVSVLILDCLRPILDAFGLDEHRDAGRFLVAFDALLGAAGASEAVVVHHMGHGEERSRGDSRLRDWPDVEIRLLRQSSEPNSTRFITAYGRDVDVPETRLVYDRSSRRLTLAEGSRRDFAVEAAKAAVLAALREAAAPVSSRQLEGLARKKGDHSQAAIRGAIRDLVGAGRILTTPGAKRAILHSLSGTAPSASECVDSQ